jgi:dipeptidyl aminopeptidase/acylaminoacyl peptidase
LGLAVAPAWGQTTTSLLNYVARTHSFFGVAMSAGGHGVAWVEDGHLYAERGGGAAVDLGPGVGPRWSPDGREIAFMDRGQVFVVPSGGGARRQLTHLTGFLTGPRWSPDGRMIAFLFAHNAVHGGGPTTPERARVGVIGSQIHNQRLTLVAAAGGEARQITPASINVYEFAWSPRGRRFVFTAAPGPGDNNWWVAQMYTASAATGAPRRVFKNDEMTGQIAMPRFSPGGHTIAFIKGLMSDEGSTGGDLYTVPANGGAERDRTPGVAYTVNSFRWTGPRTLEMAEYRGGGSQVARFDLATGAQQVQFRAEQRIHGGGGFSDFAMSHNGERAAYIRADFAHAPEVYAGELGHFHALTHANAGMKPLWGKGRSLHWTNGGYDVQGWLIYPRNFDPHKKYPMIVSVHGGPAAQNTPAWPRAGYSATLFSALGYFVLLPNPRGSFGQGERFTRANIKDFGYGDFRDIMAGVDKAIATAPIDPQRLGITGWSYGGFMTMWAVTQTHRFKAAVSGAGLSDWQSYWGENQIDQWMTPYFGNDYYHDPAVYEKSSPIRFITHAKTPTLLVVGEFDGECPAPQSFEYWSALKWLGVPTELVVYPGEGHGFRQPAHVRDVMERAAAWFQKYLQ